MTKMVALSQGHNTANRMAVLCYVAFGCRKKIWLEGFLTWFCVTSVNQTGRSMKTGLKLTIIFEF